MATLTETAAGTKKLIKISAIGAVIFLIFKLGLFIFDTYLKVVKPPPRRRRRRSALENYRH